MSTPGDRADDETRQIDIPAENRYDRPTFVSSFVGSPDHVSRFGGSAIGASETLASSVSSLAGTADAPSSPRSHRPAVRSFLSPGGSVLPPRLPAARAPSLVRRVSSRLFPSSEGIHGPEDGRSPHREWSLFTQRMTNEGQLRTPGAASPKRGVGSARVYQTLPGVSTRSSAPSALSSAMHSNVQSPTEDPTLRNPFDDAFPQSQLADDDAPDYDSDDSDMRSQYTASVAASPQSRWGRWSQRVIPPPLTALQRNIMKCGIAYFLGSLFTYNSFLSGIISDITSTDGPSQQAHMVATVAVYYNPAKTAGAMMEANLYCLVGLLFAAFVSLCSMESFWWFEVQPGWEWLADSLVLLWVGAGMSAIAWMKLWIARPSFNTACSMIAIIIFIVVVKEGGIVLLRQVFLLVCLGASISNLVCYAIWPQSATDALRVNMQKTLASFATVLTMITNTFLLEEPLHQPSQEKIQRAVDAHQASFTSLKKNLIEARSEALFGGPGRPQGRKSLGQAYEDAVDSLNRLGQHLNGLRSGTRLQYELSKAHLDGKLVLRHKRAETGKGNANTSVQEENDNGDADEDSEERALLQVAANMFGDLVDDLGPPLKALSATCKSSLQQLREALAATGSTRGFNPEGFDELLQGIDRALFTFESTSNHAMMRLYRKSLTTLETGNGSHMGQHLPQNSVPVAPHLSTADENYILHNEYENMFLVYFFIFTLQEFAREMEPLIDALGRICAIERATSARGSWWKRLWKKATATVKRARRSSRPRKSRPGMKRPVSTYFLPETHASQAWFPKVEPHAPNTIQTPARADLPWWGRVKQAVWALGARLKEHDLKYALKAGMATALLAAPAFWEATRPMFVSYRGEWALISFFVVISPTIGATNNLSIHRIMGTLLGAVTATGIYTLFPDNPVALSIFGFFFSLPCFYFIVATPQHAISGRFVLLTYNLTCLFCYNQRGEDLAVHEVAFHRAVAVTAGVVYAAVVSRVWWPSEARRELGKRLGELCLNLGWLYTRLVAHNSFAPEALDFGTALEHNGEGDGSESTPTEHSALLAQASRHRAQTKLHNSIEEFMAMELHLQIQLIELQGLLAQTQHEPRLKGPFPVALYRTILTSLQTILDRLHSMRCVTTREEWYTEVRRDFILPVNQERHEMVGQIILFFSVLSSAFRLKAPLPPYLPPAERSRQRLVDAIRQLDVVKSRDVKGSRQLLFFAYALTMKGVTQELDSLGKTLQDVFGVIGHTAAEFDALFAERPPTVDYEAPPV